MFLPASIGLMISACAVNNFVKLSMEIIELIKGRIFLFDSNYGAFSFVKTKQQMHFSAIRVVPVNKCTCFAFQVIVTYLFSNK